MYPKPNPFLPTHSHPPDTHPPVRRARGARWETTEGPCADNDTREEEDTDLAHAGDPGRILPQENVAELQDFFARGEIPPASKAVWKHIL